METAWVAISGERKHASYNTARLWTAITKTPKAPQPVVTWHVYLRLNQCHQNAVPPFSYLIDWTARWRNLWWLETQAGLQRHLRYIWGTQKQLGHPLVLPMQTPLEYSSLNRFHNASSKGYFSHLSKPSPMGSAFETVQTQPTSCLRSSLLYAWLYSV